MLIYISFNPLDIKKQNFHDVPILELKKFTMYELSDSGLETFMIGDSATRYADRYVVSKISYTDNSKDMIASMEADYGLYKNDKVILNGDVIYAREDGLTIKSQRIDYDKKTSVAISENKYIAFLNKNKITGSYLKYNGIKRKIYSKDIFVIYQIKD